MPARERLDEYLHGARNGSAICEIGEATQGSFHDPTPAAMPFA
jgi:hypothetical protein